MDVKTLLLDGGYNITNPNYNPKTKKGREESPYLKTSSMEQAHPFISKGYDINARESFIFNANDYKKYIDAGIQLNKKETPEDWDKQLAESQSALKKLMNGVAQGIIAEGVLGSARAASDLLDVVSGNIFRPDNDYSNPVSQYFEGLQEEFREYAPIYANPDLNIDNGGLSDAGWWASNIPSVMTSLSLLLPSTLTTKGIGLIGKGLNLVSKGKLAAFSRKAYKGLTGASKAKTAEDVEKLNAFSRWANNSNTIEAGKKIAEYGFNAALMRTMENYQESHQVYDDMKKQALDKFNNMSDEEYNQFINSQADKLGDVDLFDKEAVAARLAKNAADVTMQMDYINTVFDAYQLYALRNPVKFLKNMRSTGKVNKAQRASIKAMTKNAEEAEERGIAKTIKSLGRGAGQFLKDSGVAIKSELSEGVEEVVNYIAQQEGMHYGNVLLKEDVNSNFTERLKSYMASPELHDAAFWGVVGGLVFQGLGSGFNRLSVAAERYAQQKKKSTDNDTKEGTYIDSFQELFTTSENKRRVADIEGRQSDFDTLVSRLDMIEGEEGGVGQDPFNKDENGAPFKLETELEKSIARDKAINDYITRMTFRAIDNGNFDLLKEYLKDENVSKAIEERTGNENDGGAFINSLISRMDHISDLYNNNLIALSNISSGVNIKGENFIPVEYLQIVARDNAAAQLKLEDIEQQIKNYEVSANNKVALYGNKDNYDESIDYKGAVELTILTNQLAQLKTEKAEYENSTNKEGLGRQIELDKINKNIAVIEDLLEGSQEGDNLIGLARLLHAHMTSSKILDSKDYIGKSEELIKGNISSIIDDKRTKKFKLTDEKIIRLLGEDRTSGIYGKLSQDINEAFNGAYGLNKIDKRLGDDYTHLALLNMEKAILKEDITLNEDSLSKRVNELHNTMLEARSNAIEQSFKNIKDLGRKYGREVIANNLAYNTEINWENNKDKKLYEDSLGILNLTSVNNRQLYYNLQDELFRDYIIENSQKAAREPGESSTIISQPLSATSEPQVNNISAEEQKTNIEEKKPLNKGLTQETGEVTLESIITRMNNATTLEENDKSANDASKAGIPEKDWMGVYQSNAKRIAENKSSTISPTGGEEQISTSTKFDENGNPIPDENREQIEDTIGKEIAQAYKQARENNTNPIEAINNKVQELNEKYGDDEGYKNAINQKAKSWRKQAEKRGLNREAVELVLLATSVEEQPSKIKFTEDYLDQTRKFVDKFLKQTNARTIDGKTIVSSESIIRFVTEQYEDPNVAEFVRNIIKGYFETDNKNRAEHKKDSRYLIIDDINSQGIIDRAKLTNQEIITKRIGTPTTLGVSLVELFNKFDGTLINEEAKKALDSLEEGDELSVKTDNNGNINLYKNSIKIGSLPKADVTSVGAYTMTNDGWITDVISTSGVVKSKLRDLWENILLENNPINNKINDFIYKIIALNNTNGNTRQIYKELEEDKEITDYFNNLKDEGLVDKDSTNSQLISGLVKIWNYIDLTDPDPARRSRFINYSLDAWFNKLYENYSTIDTITSSGTNNYKFIVSKITKGAVIQVAENNDSGYDECTLGTDNKAFSNIEEVEFGIIKSGNTSTIQTTKGNSYFQPSSMGSVWAIFDNKSGFPGIVRGHALRFTDKDPEIDKTPAGKIRKAISDEFTRRIKKFSKAEEFEDREQTFNELEQFINLILSKNNVPVLAPVGGGKANVGEIRDTNPDRRLSIGIKVSPIKYVNFTINLSKGTYNFVKNNYKPVEDTDTFIKDFIEQVLNNTMFNIDYKAFNSDINTNTPLSGLTRRDNDGKYVITIPNGTESPTVVKFSSLKEFVMQGGGARWNTINRNGTNFEQISKHQLRNQVLNVTIQDKMTPPVEESIEGDITSEDVKNGTAIDTLINNFFGKDNEDVQRLKDLGLIPSKIVYTTQTLDKGGNPANIWYSIGNKTIYVNDNWIKDANEDPDKVIRKLIHEQLHAKLRSKGNRRKELINRIEEIYNDFKGFVDKEADDAHIRSYLFNHINNKEEKLEEFLVESLTNRELANYLNSKIIESPDTKTKKSIFNKILELLSEIFNWGVNEGTLYEKELKVLQGLTSGEEVVENKIVKENTEETPNEESDDFFGLYSDGLDSPTRGASVNEISVPSLNKFVEGFPLEDRSNVSQRILDGTFSAKCS